MKLYNRRVRFFTRTLFFVIIFLPGMFSSLSLFAEDAFEFVFNSTNKLKIVERSNIRVKENGVYSGLTYNESRAVLDYMWYEDGFSQYSGNYYVYEASKKDTRLISNLINLNEYCEVMIDDQGHYKPDENMLVPVLRSFPVFPAGEIKKGDSWRDFGVRIVDPDNSGRYTRVKFYCEYKYEGLQETKTGPKHVISAQYAMRYKPGDSIMNDPDLKQIAGRHLVSISIDDGDRSSIFMRDKLDEQYIYFDGRTREHSGFILTWYNDIVGMDRVQLAENTEKEIVEAGIEDVEIIQKDEGTGLSIQNLHFVPDSPQILPDEKGRIMAIYEVLKILNPAKILVIGHTADVGTRESQYELSEQRALTVINELTTLGFAPSIFIYEGRGGDEPVADNSTDEGRAANRRVELILLDD